MPIFMMPSASISILSAINIDQFDEKMKVARR
jgi:hypothetical protein